LNLKFSNDLVSYALKTVKVEYRSITNLDFFHEDLNVFVFFEMQIPLYTASIFQSENDGEGMNVVLYFKLSEKYSKDLSEQFRENITVSY